MTQEEINNILEQPDCQNVINSPDFYFEKGQDALNKWLNLNVNDALKSELIALSTDYEKLQKEATTKQEIRDVLDLLFEIISYCDVKAKNKHMYNQYSDKRTLAEASVRMGNWMEGIIRFKFNHDPLSAGSIRNAFNYLLDPQNNTTVLSENHRAVISTNLFKKEYNANTFIDDLKQYFQPFGLNVENQDNYTELLAILIYAVGNEWKEEVVGLMASDGTGWQDEHIEEMSGFDSCIIWNSKRPSGTINTLKFLRNIVNEGGSFPLYYSSGGNVNYKADIIDFAEKQDDLDKKQWDKKQNILYYHDKFEDYKDSKKSASIVFLANSIEKINPISVSEFKFYKEYDAPRQDNLSPIKSEPQTITKISTVMSKKYSIAEFEKMFKEYLIKVIPKSASNYLSAAPTLNRIGVRLELIQESFYEIQDPSSFVNFYNNLKTDAEYLEKNKTGHHMYSSSLKKYKKFIEELSGEEAVSENPNNLTMSLNQILFGPPGTGKTYNSINKAITIINPSFDLTQERKLVKDEFDRLIRNGQIVFTTFHQSMSYEDFIEGIKPLEPKQEGQPVIYKVVNGILKKFCNQIKSSEKLTNTGNETATVANFEELYAAFLKRLTEIISKLEEGDFHIFPSRRSNVKLLKLEGEGISTSGESANTIETITKDKLKRIYDKFQSPDDITNINEQLRKEVGTDIGWTTNYYAVFKAIKDFEKSITTTTIEHKVVAPKNYVLIIDEINRGNVSQIFGELITLIEDDKRLGKPEALEATLAYSKERFGIPPNLYLVGTMNTADRSVEALDTALRRRFTFEEIPPKYDLAELQYDYADSVAFEILKTINNRIEKLIDKDHLIGHSYFILKDEEDAEEKLINSFYKNIIPLLQEYFFGDFGKIGLVLGKGFLELKNWDEKTDSFAAFDHESSNDFDSREVYKIVDYRDKNLNYKIEINKNTIKMDFEKAIKLLMKKEIA
ncbi:MAG: AAA family ATPase [bacterium]|nr:AAA family ATPase [bacterium]